MRLSSRFKLSEKGFAHHFILPVVAIVAVAGIGTYLIKVNYAANLTYYSGHCTNATLSLNSKNASCVAGAKALMDAVEHQEIATRHSYRTATKAGPGVFQYGKYYYIYMNGTYDSATQTAVKNLDRSTTLTGGTSSNAGWQILCRAAVAYGFTNTSKSTSAGSQQLNFNTRIKGEYTKPASMDSIFNYYCGKLTKLQKPSGGSGGSSNGGGSGSTTPPVSSGSGGGSSNPGRFGIALGGGWQGYNSSQLNAYFADMQSMGVQWVRYDITWAQVQPSSSPSYNWGAFDNVAKAAKAHNLKVLAILDMAPTWAQQSSCAGQTWCPPNGASNFAAFASAAASHYAPLGVTTFEIWNEENQPIFWINPNAANYTALLKGAYTAIHRAEPNDFVVSGGVSPGAPGLIQPNTFVQQMYANGAKGYFDALGIHPYCFSDPSVCATSNSSNTDVWGQMAYGPNNIKGIMQAKGDGGKQIWMTEFGDDNSASEAAQEMKSAFTLTNGQTWAGPIFWYDYIGDGSFGLLDSNGNHTQAYNTYKQLTGK